MRAALAAIAALALCASPVLAQGKTKAPQTPIAIEVLEVCEAFASVSEGAEDLARERGWTVEPGVPETSFIETVNLYKSFPGVGGVEGYTLVETYPNTTFGYCRVDLPEPEGEADVRLIDDLDRWEGNLTEEGAGTYGSWEGIGDHGRLLLSHEDEFSFVLQLTDIDIHGGPFRPEEVEPE